MKSLPAIIGLALLSSTGVRAQTADPSSASSPHQQSVTGAPGAPQTVSPDASPSSAASPHQKSAMRAAEPTGGAQFVTKASQAGMAEVELSKLAINKANDAQVKSFANQMVQDHTKANEELKSIASKSGLSVAPALDPDHAATVRDLGQKSGKAFDQAYVQQMVADHQQAVSLFQQETNDSNSELAGFAGKTLPVLQHHQEMVAALAKH